MDINRYLTGTHFIRCNSIKQRNKLVDIFVKAGFINKYSILFDDNSFINFILQEKYIHPRTDRHLNISVKPSDVIINANQILTNSKYNTRKVIVNC